ncbi:hypothetical protein B0H14DRAFT_2571764 [Mycena olivaceomarginata]|nr:hypothetical protein B0H14DRAFT_2571764 [Mycena olivaceomarginata]
MNINPQDSGQYDLEVTEIGEGSGNRQKDSDFQGFRDDLFGYKRSAPNRESAAGRRAIPDHIELLDFPAQLLGSPLAWWNNRSYFDCGNSDETENETGGNINLLTALEVKNGASAKKAILKAVGDQGIQLLFVVCGLPHIRACSCGCGPKKKKGCGYTLFGNLG